MEQLQDEHRQLRRVISNELLGASYIVFECGDAPTEPHHIIASRECFPRHFPEKKPSPETIFHNVVEARRNAVGAT
jgi:hypothetical protein